MNLLEWEKKLGWGEDEGVGAYSALFALDRWTCSVSFWSFLYYKCYKYCTYFSGDHFEFRFILVSFFIYLCICFIEYISIEWILQRRRSIYAGKDPLNCKVAHADVIIRESHTVCYYVLRCNWIMSSTDT